MKKKSLILGVETSGRIGSVAIALGEKMLAETIFSGTMRHSSEIFPAIRSLLEKFARKPKDIEHVYVSAGPGSFTGLRIAVALAKTMHLANDAKVIAVNTLDVIAANTSDHMKEEDIRIDKIATVLDAKRGQFFIAAYKLRSCESSDTQYEKILPDCLMTASQFLEEFAASSEPIWLLGEGLLYYKDAFRAESVHFLPEKYWRPKAEKVHLLGWKKALAGQFANPLTLQPTYLRRPEAEEKWQKQNANS